MSELKTKSNICYWLKISMSDDGTRKSLDRNYRKSKENENEYYLGWDSTENINMLSISEIY